MAKKGGLGKGLGALFEMSAPEGGEGAVLVPISDLVPNKEQPRKEFSEEALLDLSESIKKYGVLQPIIVKPLPDTTYKIVAGERRYRAAMMASVSEVPVIIKEISDKEVSEIALIENLQREDLNPVEEALGYKNLQESYSLTQDEIASSVGKSRSAVANSLRLLSLPEEVIEMLKNGELTGGHARALISLSDEKVIVEAAKRFSDTKASVREAEKFVKKQKAEKVASSEEKEDIFSGDSFIKETELALKEATGRAVKISGTEKKGKVIIEFFSREELSEIANILGENLK